MTNEFYSENAIINIYVANLDECKSNNKVGGWVSLPIDEYHFKDFLKAIGNPKAYAIHDYENNTGIDDLDIWEGMSIEELNALCKRIGKINIEEIYIINALYEALEDLEQALDYYESDNYVYYGDMTLEEVAQENIKEYYDIPKGLENYIDYRLYARDMDTEGFYHTTTYGTIKIL